MIKLSSLTKWCFSRQKGQNQLLALGLVGFSMTCGTLVVDIPMYFNQVRQVQTLTDAAALAGANKAPLGESQAKQAALDMAKLNPNAGGAIKDNQLSMTVSQSSMTVTTTSTYPLLFGRFLCNNCASVPIKVSSMAQPAARDTVLVIDASSSMADLGNNRPMNDVKSAAKLFVDTISAQNNALVDRIAVVSFSQSANATQKIGLTSKTSGGGFSAVKTAIDGISLFSGTGWNTNYEAGLHKAIDILEASGRPNANKQIFFMTDGQPNLPAPANYYTYSASEPYRKCTDIVNNSSQVKAMCTTTYVNGQKKTTCPVLPNSKITDSMISQAAVDCGNTYINYMQSATNIQTDRAKNDLIVISYITIDDPNTADNAQSILRRLIKNPTWKPSQLNYMATTTGGKGFAAANYDSTAISNYYKDYAKNIHVKLTG